MARRLTEPDEPANKLNKLIDNVHRIWSETAEQSYLRPDGALADPWRRADDLLRPRHNQRRSHARLLGLLPAVEHRQSRYLNNRAESSHRPTRRRERQMQRFKSPEQAQDFLSAHAFIHGHFHPTPLSAGS
jgi:hypothetical protein